MSRNIPYFNGTDSYITVPAFSGMPLGNSPHTIEVIVSPTKNAVMNILSYGADTTNNRRMLYTGSAGEIHFNNYGTNFSATGTLPFGTISITSTYDGSISKNLS